MWRINWMFLFLLVTGKVAYADGLDMYGNISYEISGEYVTLSVETIENSRSGGYTGTLKLKLWAVETPYSGGDIRGYVLGQAVLGQLSGGYNYSGVVQTVSFDDPPQGNYYIVMTLTEYNGQDHIEDYSQFNERKTFDGNGNQNGGDDGLVHFDGNVGYEIFGEFVTLSADTVINDRNGGVTGTLKMKLWAVDVPYAGGAIEGHVIGEYVLGQLNGGQYFYGISQTVDLAPPPRGSYYLVMTLTEYQGGDYIIDYTSFDDLVSFDDLPMPLPPGPSPEGGGSSDGGSDGGGSGGAIPYWLLLAGLGLCLAQRRR